MGQYFKGIILSNPDRRSSNNDGKILASVCAWDYNDSAKLVEHSYTGSNMVAVFEALIEKGKGRFAGHPVVWAGDYATDELPDNEDYINLYELTKREHTDLEGLASFRFCRYIINESKKQFVDVNKVEPNSHGCYAHPLPLLCAEGNSDDSNGNYRGRYEKAVGKWARDVVVVSDDQPGEEYEEVRVYFSL